MGASHGWFSGLNWWFSGLNWWFSGLNWWFFRVFWPKLVVFQGFLAKYRDFWSNNGISGQIQDFWPNNGYGTPGMGARCRPRGHLMAACLFARCHGGYTVVLAVTAGTTPGTAPHRPVYRIWPWGFFCVLWSMGYGTLKMAQNRVKFHHFLVFKSPPLCQINGQIPVF